MAGSGSSLKSAALLDLMKDHFTTDAGKDLTKKIGFVYQLNIAPEVRPFLLFPFFQTLITLINLYSLFFSTSRRLESTKRSTLSTWRKAKSPKVLIFTSYFPSGFSPSKFSNKRFISMINFCSYSLGAYKGKPDVTFSFKDEDFLAIATGKMNPQIAFIR